MIGVEDLVHIAVLLGIVICALMVIRLRDLISAALAVGACSLLLALEFFILQAPDVAIAEAGVGAALTTAIFVLAIKDTQRMEDY
ncbi:MAG: DUF4040 domain-containing protein [Candidatus Thermoplasmatota archaeon]|nr:DUF4040 domain-containing protein [Candidatus Thermoplasmatota archaeon]